MDSGAQSSLRYASPAHLEEEMTMPMLGRRCMRDGRTVCLRMSQTGLPVNHEGPGLRFVYGWSSEERRAQGHPASIQGVELRTHSGEVLALDYCPFCGENIAGSATSVRVTMPRRTAPEEVSASKRPPTVPESARTPSPSAVVERAERARRASEVVPPDPPSAPVRAQEATDAASLKALREELGLSQAKLGEKLGLARGSIANYENGWSPLSSRVRKWIAKQEAKLAERGAGAAVRRSTAA
jgi:DNA-binding XRE family transcriptional regulator